MHKKICENNNIYVIIFTYLFMHYVQYFLCF